MNPLAMFEPVDIIEELSKERLKQEQQADNFLQSAVNHLNHAYNHEEDINSRLVGTYQQPSTFQLSIEQINQLDYNLMFTSTVVQSIATKYRLRFLNTKLYVGKIPHEAKLKIKKIEQDLNIKFEKFKILAPASRFKLADSTEDPILFAEMGNGSYYMIHKWGDDMNWYRSAVSFPFRNIVTLGLSCVTLSLLINLFLPSSLL